MNIASPASLATGAPAAKARLAWIDAAKAFAIVFVVFGHAWRGVYDGGLLTSAALFQSVDNSIYLFHMPLFFFLSGMTFAGERQAWLDFLRRLGRATVLPYMIWSVALVAIKQLGQGSVNHPVGFADLLGIAYTPISPFWFFYALFLIQLATRLALPAAGARGVLVLSLLAFAAHFINPDKGTAIDSGLEFFLFFAMGLALRPLRSQPPRIGARRALLATLVFLATPLLCLLWQLDYTTLPGRLAAIPMGLAAFAFFIWFGGTALGRSWPVQLTGQATLAIYCLHIFFTGTTRAVLVKLGIVDLGPHLILSVGLGVVAPIVIHLVATRLGLAGWLGFPRLTWPMGPALPA